MAQPPRQKAPTSTRAPCLYTLHIELQPDEIYPLIWRKLEVDGRVSLGKLHHFIQTSFGWGDAHLHDFEIRGRNYAIPNPEDLMDEPEIEDERKAFLNRLVDTGDSILYRYDFGDNWNHQIWHTVRVSCFSQLETPPKGACSQAS